ERGMKLDHRFVSEDFDPAHSIGVCPHRVVDAREVRCEMAAAVFEQMRKKKAHLVMRERVLARPQSFVPDCLRRRLGKRRRDKLVPHVGRDSAFGANASGERVQEVKSPGYLPSAEIARRRASPHVRSESRTSSGYLARDFDDLIGVDAALAGGILGCVFGIEFLYRINESLKRAGKRWPLFAHELFPVDPAPNELAIECVVLQN